MKSTFLLLITGLMVFSLTAQEINPNLNFERFEANNPYPENWFRWGTPDFKVCLDTTLAQDGRVSGYVAHKEGAGERSFGCITHRLPGNFSGKEIRLEGYMKIKDVANGFAGLLMRLDSDDGFVGFDNMQQENIQGTHDWKKYVVTLPFSDEVQTIYVAGILTGQGEAWFDNFSLTLDGKPISALEPRKEKLFPADLDTAFTAGSGIELEGLLPFQQNNLEKLARIWGFVKYYHPAVAAGEFNMDNELFRILPSVISTSDQQKVNAALATWVDKFGAVTAAGASPFSDTAALKAPVEWIGDEQTLGKVLSEKLMAIRDAQRPNQHYYIGMVPNIGNPQFKKEKPYEQMDYRDEGIKLLGLFRYWNMIQYFFPYRDIMDEDWDQVLTDFIPKMVNANNELDYKLAMLQLIGKIQDTHANIWGQEPVLTAHWGENILPVGLSPVKEKLVVTRLFTDQLPEDHGLHLGDVLTQVNGKGVDQIIKDLLPYSPASNRPTQLRDIARKLIRTADSTLTIQVDRGGSSLDLTLPTVAYQSINLYKVEKPSYELLEDNIGYIYPGTLERGAIIGIMEELKNTKGLIVDLRTYPSDFIVFSLGGRLVDAPTEFVKFTGGGLQAPGEFHYTPTIQIEPDGKGRYPGKVVILINETTQSQAEYTTMALRTAPGAVVIGSTTAGADGNVSQIYLPGNIRTMISGIGVFYPDGSPTQRVGILPDIELHPTVEGIRAGRDELLERAREVILNK